MTDKYINCKLLYEDSVNNMNRVVRLDDGTLFTIGVVKKNIYNIGAYPMCQYVFSRKSYDNGITWTLPVTLFEFPDKRMFNDIGQFMISREGFLHLFTYRIWKYDFEKNEFKGDIMHARMDDTDGTNLIFQKIECLDRYTGSLNNLIQLESGRLVIPFSTLDEKTGVFQSSTVISDDEGNSWNVSNQITVESEETDVESGAVEPVVAEVEENKLVMLIRTVLGNLYYSISYNGGESWSASSRSNIKSSNAPAVIQKLKDGRFFVSWNNCNGMPMRGVRYSMARQCLHAAVSDDGLKTLKGIRIIVKKDEGDPDDVLNCYPFSSLGEDDEILVRLMTIQSKDREKWPEPNAKLVTLDPDFLYETEVENDIKHWISDTASESNELLIRGDDEGPGYATVNFPYGQSGGIQMEFELITDDSDSYLILSDNYMDVSNFKINKVNEKFNKYIEGNYVKIPIESKIGKNCLKIIWDNDIEVICNGTKRKYANSFAGFNHIGLLIYKGEIEIMDFREKSDKAWLDTGIEY